ncbi:MAG: energy-coupling factor transporter transmembrane protein EcfT [Actinomycetes bacterium]|jgi:cobalt/nickel transport system permease protein|nr:energy-coupling factor transporter transmembrane protein EcfT [Actinomycetes bacterium]
MHKLATAHSEDIVISPYGLRIIALDIRAKLIGGLVLIVAITTAPAMNLSRFALCLAALLLTALLLGDRVGAVLRGATVVLAFAGVIALTSPLALLGTSVASPDLGMFSSTLVTIHTVAEAYAYGWPLIWEILSKAWLSVIVVNVVMKSTTWTGVLQGLDALHLPRVFLVLLTFLYRFSDLFRQQIREMQSAIRSRAPQLGSLRRVLLYGKLGGNLFVRAYERGEAIYDAMLSRGYGGSLPTLRQLRWRLIDTAALTLCIAGAAALLLGS